MHIIDDGARAEQLQTAALNYAAHGLPVLPLHSFVEGSCTCEEPGCGSAGKHPLLADGSHGATKNEAMICHWWEQAPLANVGVATRPGGVWVLGPDGADGIAALATLEAQHGALPVTPRAKTGGGGRHLYFAWPDGVTIPNRKNHRGLPIDVRGLGGLVVAPPSVNRAGGYTWDLSFDDCAPAEAPAWLIAWVLSEGDATPASAPRVLRVAGDADPVSRARAYAAKCPPAISGQEGHNQTFWLACQLVQGFALSGEQALSVLREWNVKCEPPWSEKELRHKVAEAAKQGNERGYLLDRGDISSNSSNSHGLVNLANDDIEATPLPEPTRWPTLPEEALYGIAGDAVRMLLPETESDLAALLMTLLVGVGSAIGRGPYFQVEGSRHHANLFIVLVGESSRGRKGTSLDRTMQLLEPCDPEWYANCRASGLTSGEGLIFAVRDAVEGMAAKKKRGSQAVEGFAKVVKDAGVHDKRLLITESEFAQVLRTMGRDGNVLSAVLRQAWDSGTLRTLVKNNPAKATGAHVSVLAHITKPELTKYLGQAELFNGFANRFLWGFVRRSKLLPDGGKDVDLSSLIARLKESIVAARGIGRVRRTPAADRLWREIYPKLTADRAGLAGAVTSRAEAQTVRLSLLYALLDGEALIDTCHLQAALAVERYCRESATIIYGGVAEPEDVLADRVEELLLRTPTGMTRTELHRALGNHVSGGLLVRALARLRDQGRARYLYEQTGGKPAERWFALRTPCEVDEFDEVSPASAPIGGLNSSNSQTSPGFEELVL